MCEAALSEGPKFIADTVAPIREIDFLVNNAGTWNAARIFWDTPKKIMTLS